jgi:hypothetical protein
MSCPVNKYFQFFVYVASNISRSSFPLSYFSNLSQYSLISIKLIRFRSIIFLFQWLPLFNHLSILIKTQIFIFNSFLNLKNSENLWTLFSIDSLPFALLPLIFDALVVENDLPLIVLKFQFDFRFNAMTNLESEH